jgi:hypothetical protein
MRGIAIAVAASAIATALADAAFGANTVTIKNSGPTPVQIGFDRNALQTLAPRAIANVTLGAGQHSAQCRFEGSYDGCNIEEEFTLADGRQFTIELRPVYTLQHAITLAQQGALKVETRRDTVWATKAEDVAGADTDCADYQAGKLAAIATKLRSGIAVDQLALATQRLCNEARPVVAVTIGGEKIYVQPNFLVFRERDGRPIQIRQ